MKRVKKRKEQNSRRALLSVYYKEGIVDFAKALARLGFEIVSSGGTSKALQSGKVPCLSVEDVTRSAPMLGGRVKTLHPKIFGAILAMLTKEHEAQLKARGIKRIKLVCVDLYPVWAALVSTGVTVAEVLELIDIGGVALLRAAAKNFNNGVVVICDPADRQRVIDALEANGEVGYDLRLELAGKAFALTRYYDSLIERWFAEQQGRVVETITMERVRTLRKAESEDRSPSELFRGTNRPYNDPLAWDKWTFVSGNPGHVNLCGGDNALAVMCRLAEACRVNFKGRVPHIAIACKHGNPCGLGVDWQDPSKALERAMFGDPTAVMGSEVMTNFVITGQEAAVMHVVPKRAWRQVGRDFWGPDVIYAPAFNEIAESLLTTRKTDRYLVANPALANPTMPPYEYSLRQIRGGWLRQKAPTFILNLDNIQELIGKKRLARDEKVTLLIAWVVAWEGVSNSATLAKNLMLIGTGLGQQDRRGAFILALLRAETAGHNPEGSFWGSDGFVPYARRKEQGDPPEPVESMIEKGCIGGVLPADGKNWPEVRALLEESGMFVAAVGAEHRGFNRH